MTSKFKQKKLRYSIAGIYLLVLIGVFAFVRTFWTPDLIFISLLGLFIILGEGKQFFLHFLPFVILLLSYEKLRSLAPLINSHVHYTEMIRFDRWVFGGTTPTQLFQSWLYHGDVQWYDFVFYFVYMMHFVTPLILAVMIWRLRPKYYWTYVTALLLLSYAGFLTYVAFPAAPPWLASEQGILTPQITHISTSIWYAFGVHNFSSYYKQLSPNLVAAMPSLHAAYPFLLTLFVRKIWGNKWFYISLAYPFTIWFGVMYLGEHYLIDVLVGIIYALACYFAAPYVLNFAQINTKKLYRHLTHKEHRPNKN